MTLTHSFLLPHSNHRWVTAACGLQDGAFIVGDGKGSLHLYSNFSTQSIFSINKLHSSNPVTSLQTNSDFVYSTGRDGKLKIIQMTGEKMVVRNSIQVYRSVSGSRVFIWTPVVPFCVSCFMGVRSYWSTLEMVQFLLVCRVAEDTEVGT